MYIVALLSLSMTMKYDFGDLFNVLRIRGVYMSNTNIEKAKKESCLERALGFKNR